MFVDEGLASIMAGVGDPRRRLVTGQTLLEDGRVVGDLLGCEHVGNHTITLVLEMGSVNLEVLGHSEVPESTGTSAHARKSEVSFG